METERKNAYERGHVYPRVERLCVGEHAMQECVHLTKSMSSAVGRTVLSETGAPELCDGYSLRCTGGCAPCSGSLRPVDAGWTV